MKTIVKIIYGFIVWILSFRYLRKYRKEIGSEKVYQEILGNYPSQQQTGKSIWIHCASVGESKIAAVLIRKLREHEKTKRIVLTVRTTTGRASAGSLIDDLAEVRYCPYESKKAVRQAYDHINPEKFILIETELWPNLLCEARDRKVPIYLVNGRISDESFSRYMRLKMIISGYLSSFSLCLMQSQKDCDRIIALGADSKKCEIVQNLKYDVMQSELQNIDPDKIRSDAGLSPSDRFLIAGSIRLDEYKVVISTYQKLLLQYPQLRLILVPRHTERVSEIESYLDNLNLSYNKRSQNNKENNEPVFILDTTGELTSFYSICEAAFVGGSLVDKGGQNPLEPVGLAVPTCYGHHMGNFVDIDQTLQKLNLVTQINDSEQLFEFFDSVLKGDITAPDPKKLFEKYAVGADISVKKILEG